ncbi:MAG: hypothetical protein RSC34_04020 [Alistipes sp.]
MKRVIFTLYDVYELHRLSIPAMGAFVALENMDGKVLSEAALNEILGGCWRVYTDELEGKLFARLVPVESGYLYEILMDRSVRHERFSQSKKFLY